MYVCFCVRLAWRRYVDKPYAVKHAWQFSWSSCRQEPKTHLYMFSHICLRMLGIDNLHRIYRDRQFQAADDLSHVEARPSSHVPILSRGMLICTASVPPRPGPTHIRPPRSLTTLLEFDLMRSISPRGCGGRTVVACCAGTADILLLYI